MSLTDFLLARIAEDEAANRRGPEPESWCDRGEGLHLSYSRVITECEAKRLIVDEMTGDSAEGLRDARVILRLLAWPYAEHPDYREEWNL